MTAALVEVDDSAVDDSAVDDSAVDDSAVGGGTGSLTVALGIGTPVALSENVPTVGTVIAGPGSSSVVGTGEVEMAGRIVIAGLAGGGIQLGGIGVGTVLAGGRFASGSPVQ